MILLLRASHVAPDPRVEKEARTLAQSGWSVRILAWDRENELSAHETMEARGAGHVDICRAKFRAPHGAGISNLAALIRFQLFLLREGFRERRQVRAVHACDLSTGLTGWVLARALRVPLVYDIFDFYADSFPVPKRSKPMVKRLERWVINRADATILPTPDRLPQLGPCSPRRLLFLHNAPGTSELPAEAARELAERDRVHLVYVGILAPHRLLSEVIPLVARRLDWRLDIGGFGPLEQVVVAACEQSPNITFHGRLPYAKALKLEAASDIMFATYDPSVANHRFSAPNKFYEALALGKPLIVCSQTGIDDLVLSAGIGMAVAYDVNAFEVAVDAIHADVRGRANIAEIGPALYAENYAWEVMAPQLISLYESLAP